MTGSNDVIAGAPEVLGADGAASDEAVTTCVRRGARLVAQCWGQERVVDPATAADELDHGAAISREMAKTCSRQGGGAGDYWARVRAQEGAAAIRAAFGLVSPAGA